MRFPPYLCAGSPTAWYIHSYPESEYEQVLRDISATPLATNRALHDVWMDQVMQHAGFYDKPSLSMHLHYAKALRRTFRNAYTTRKYQHCSRASKTLEIYQYSRGRSV